MPSKMWTWIVVLAVPVVAYFALAGWMVSGGLRDFALVDGGEFSDRAMQTDDPLQVDFDGDPGVAFGWPFEDVRIPSELGELPAWVVPGPDGVSDTWMIYVHGVGAQRENGYRLTSVARPLGITTLLLSYRNDRGAPRAPDNIYRAGLTEWHDLDAGVRFALQRGAHHIILAGDSMGGAIVGQFMRHSTSGAPVAAAVLDAPALDIPAVAHNFVVDSGLPFTGTVTRIGLHMLDWRLGVNYLEAVSVDTMAQRPARLFVAHGSTDPLVPVTTSDHLHTLRPDMTYLRTGAVHIQSWQEDPARYQQVLGDFLQGVLADL